MAMAQSDRGIYFIEGPSSQLTLACVNLTKNENTSKQQQKPKQIYMCT